MSPLDRIIFLFFILVTIRAALMNIDFWKQFDEECAEESAVDMRRCSAQASRPVSRRSACRTVEKVRVIPAGITSARPCRRHVITSIPEYTNKPTHPAKRAA